MSKGASKLGTSSVTSVTVQNGRTLTLSSPLAYDRKDKAIGKQARTAVDTFETAHRGDRVENILLTDDNGKQIYTNVGGKGSVSFPSYLLGKATVMTHNHPRPGKYENVLGGTFSPADVRVISDRGSTVTTIRATAAEGTYSLSVPSNVNRAAMGKFVKAYGNYIRGIKKTYGVTQTQKYVDYQLGKITYGQYKSACNHIMNDMLIDMHNWLRNNKNTYGYSYTLEK